MIPLVLSILFSLRKIIFRGASLPLKMVRPSVDRCVAIMLTMEEVTVDAYVGRHGNQDEKEEGRLLAEMHPDLPEGYGCILAPMIVDVANSTAVSVYLFNPHSYLVVVRQDFMMGRLESVDMVSTISRYENPTAKGNFTAIRWLLLKENSVLLNKAGRVKKGQKNSFVQNIQEPLAPLLDHLTELYECSVEGKAKYEKKRIHWLLLKTPKCISHE